MGNQVTITCKKCEDRIYLHNNYNYCRRCGYPYPNKIAEWITLESKNEPIPAIDLSVYEEFKRTCFNEKITKQSIEFLRSYYNNTTN